jgi:nucleotide-binding universal stress UspA family protein
MKILLPVDGSKASDRAVGELLSYIPMLRDAPRIEMLYVHLPLRPMPIVQGVVIDMHGSDKYYEAETRTATAAAVEQLQRHNIDFSLSTAVGEPAEEICKVALEKQCDMIWMGTRGMGGFANLFLGSVATKVLHRAHTPVVLIPAKHQGRGQSRQSG